MKTVHIVCEAGNPTLLMPPFDEYNPSSIERTPKVSISLTSSPTRAWNGKQMPSRSISANVEKKKEKWIYFFKFPFENNRIAREAVKWTQFKWRWRVDNELTKWMAVLIEGTSSSISISRMENKIQRADDGSWWSPFFCRSSIIIIYCWLTLKQFRARLLQRPARSFAGLLSTGE